MLKKFVAVLSFYHTLQSIKFKVIVLKIYNFDNKNAGSKFLQAFQTTIRHVCHQML